MSTSVLELISGGRVPTITVFGDYCLDRYLYIDSIRDELSVETDLVAYQVHCQKMYAGAAGTIVNNLRALGAKVYCVGVIGDDGEGFELTKRLEETGADHTYMVHTNERQTCTYTKPMYLENGTQRELNRLDIRNFTVTPRHIEDALLANLETAASKSDAVIICDQFLEEDMAAVTARVREGIAGLANKYGSIVWYADSRGHIDRFANVIVKCNHKEIAAIFGENADSMTYDDAERLAKRLYDKNQKPIIVTMGERGSVTFDGTARRVPVFKVEGPVDICGAGDACNAGTVFALSLGAELCEAALMGNACSSLVIKQIGVTGVARLKDVQSKLNDYFNGGSK